MGDFRAEIKIKMELMGKKYEHVWDQINYSDNGDGIDQRVVDWFAECWKDTQRRYDNIIEKANKKERDAQEKELYLRLKSKFEPANQLKGKE